MNTIPEDFIAKVEVAGSKPVSRSIDDEITGREWG